MPKINKKMLEISEDKFYETLDEMVDRAIDDQWAGAKPKISIIQ